jgi:hypothetical protein
MSAQFLRSIVVGVAQGLCLLCVPKSRHAIRRYSLVRPPTRACLNLLRPEKSLSWGWAGCAGGAGVRRAGSAGEDPDLDQVVGEYPVSAPDRRSRSAVQADAVPAVAVFEVS